MPEGHPKATLHSYARRPLGPVYFARAPQRAWHIGSTVPTMVASQPAMLKPATLSFRYELLVRNRIISWLHAQLQVILSEDESVRATRLPHPPPLLLGRRHRLERRHDGGMVAVLLRHVAGS